MAKSRRILVAILDIVAQEFVGIVTIHRHTAAAVRMFVDVASADPNQSAVARHPEDHDLIQLGYLDDDNKLVPEHELLIAGKAWVASTTREQPATPIKLEA